MALLPFNVGWLVPTLAWRSRTRSSSQGVDRPSRGRAQRCRIAVEALSCCGRRMIYAANSRPAVREAQENAEVAVTEKNRQRSWALVWTSEVPASSSSTRTAVAPVLGFENREKKSPANKPIRRMSRRT